MSSGEKARTVLMEVRISVQGSESLFSSCDVLKFLLRYPLETPKKLETADSCMSKIFQTITCSQKNASFQYRNKPGLCTLLSAVTMFASLFMFWKKKSCFASVKSNLGTVYDSSAYGHFDINPFYLYPKRKMYLLWTSFFLPVILVYLALVWCGNPRLSGVSNICNSHTDVSKLLRQPVLWTCSWNQK